MKKRIIVIGGSAAGPKVASRARRMDENAEITIFQKASDLSMASCGYPYYVGGLSGKKALDILIPKIIGSDHTFKVFSYKGLGKIPRGLKSTKNAKARILLDQLPRILKGYGNTFSKQSEYFPAVVIIVCDLDDNCPIELKRSLQSILNMCIPRPETYFCFSIEEGEAWLLGDFVAIKTAYPKCKNHILENYSNDSICGTWELLADAIYPGGATSLKKKGWSSIGEEKSTWAAKICPHMDVQANLSPSFAYFKNTLLSQIKPSL